MPKKQNITVTGRAANKRIERAIPLFRRRFGMATDQATAVAIRLESLGRLEVSGAPIPKRSPRGEPSTVPPLAVLTAIRAMKKDRTPTKTVVRDGQSFVTNDPFLARKKISKTKRVRRGKR